MVTNEKTNKARKKIIIVTRLYTGLQDSIQEGRWVPKGIPAIYKLIEKIDCAAAAAGLLGPADGEDACYVICDERVNPPPEVEAGRVSFLVGLRTTRTGEYSSFLVTHSPDGSRVPPARSTVLPAGTRMTVKGMPPESRDAEARKSRTVAQELFGYYREPRPTPAAPVSVPLPEAAAAGRRDQDAIARFHRDFRGGSERL